MTDLFYSLLYLANPVFFFLLFILFYFFYFVLLSPRLLLSPSLTAIGFSCCCDRSRVRAAGPSRRVFPLRTAVHRRRGDVHAAAAAHFDATEHALLLLGAIGVRSFDERADDREKTTAFEEKSEQQTAEQE